MIVLGNGLVISKFSLPHVARFALELRDRLRLSSFIETGTYLGATARWAAKHFAKVATIEVKAEFYEKARASAAPNMHCFLGDSKDLLPTVLDDVPGPALVYLDAHNFRGVFGNTPDNCPLLAELAAALAGDPNNVVLVDDLSSFANPISDACPSLESLTAVTDRYERRYGVALDILAIVPQQASDLLRDFTTDPGACLTMFPVFADENFQPGDAMMNEAPDNEQKAEQPEEQSEMPMGIGKLTFNEDLIEIIPAKKPEENQDPEPPAA